MERLKYVLVTGSTKGIGRAIVEKFLAIDEYFVIANYSDDDVAADKFANEFSGEGGRLRIIKANLSSVNGAKELVEEVRKFTKSLDCLVLNAGINNKTPFEKLTKEEWDYIFDTNVAVPFFIVQMLADILRDNISSIQFIGSIMGIYPHSTSALFGITKAAVHQMAKELVKVFSNRNITVNAIAPGFVETAYFPGNRPIDRVERIINKIAHGRMGKPAEVADLVFSVFKNKFINGSVLTIDGGYSYM